MVVGGHGWAWVGVGREGAWVGLGGRGWAWVVVRQTREPARQLATPMVGNGIGCVWVCVCVCVWVGVGGRGWAWVVVGGRVWSRMRRVRSCSWGGVGGNPLTTRARCGTVLGGVQKVVHTQPNLHRALSRSHKSQCRVDKGTQSNVAYSQPMILLFTPQTMRETTTFQRHCAAAAGP